MENATLWYAHSGNSNRSLLKRNQCSLSTVPEIIRTAVKDVWKEAEFYSTKNHISLRKR